MAMDSSMCSEVEQTLVALADDIRSRDARIAQLQRFLSHIETLSTCFTTDEIRSTQSYIDVETTERARLCALLAEKVSVYEMRMLELHTKMTQRREAIENDSGLDAVPELLEIFVQQQAAMKEQLDTAHKFLMS